MSAIPFTNLQDTSGKGGEGREERGGRRGEGGEGREERGGRRGEGGEGREERGGRRGEGGEIFVTLKNKTIIVLFLHTINTCGTHWE